MRSIWANFYKATSIKKQLNQVVLSYGENMMNFPLNNVFKMQ